jgi:hypothetical protein
MKANDRYSYTPLRLAAYEGHKEDAQLLMASKADIKGSAIQKI